MVTQLRSGRAWIRIQPVWLQTLVTPSSTVPLLSHSWFGSPGMVLGRSEDLSVKFSRIILLVWPAQGLQQIERRLVLPLCLTAAWGLTIIIRINCHQWQCGRSSDNSDLHLHRMRSRGFLLEDYLSERIQSQPFKKAASESCRKMKGFFLDLKSSPGNCVPQSPSLKRFISTKCFQIGNIQKITEANIYWALTMCQDLSHVVYLNLILFLHQL